jgi:hypothetical protein
MRAERRLLRLGEYLVGRACQRLPPDIREERYQEWAAELPVILHDAQIRLAPRRAVRMLGYAADTFRGTALTHVRARRQTPAMTAALSLLLLAGMALVAWNIWNIVRAPGHPLNYLQLAWSLLLVAAPISMLVRPATRVTTLIVIIGILPGVAFRLWDAAQAPGDWVNYVVAACLVLSLLALWIVSRSNFSRRFRSVWTRRRRCLRPGRQLCIPGWNRRTLR